jgi:uncharacterized protein (TIGR02594 family)
MIRERLHGWRLFEEGETRWKWGRVKEGDGGINYHKKTGINMSSMVGNSNPWCASFINYCLKESGYSTSGSASSQSFSNNKIKVSQPIYGAIVVLRKKDLGQDTLLLYTVRW